jgi:hypothetical protein
VFADVEIGGRMKSARRETIERIRRKVRMQGVTAGSSIAQRVLVRQRTYEVAPVAAPGSW